MKFVWVKGQSGDKEAVMFPLSRAKRLKVDAIAEYWGLQPGTVKVGELVLTRDGKGNSTLSLDKVIYFAPPGSNGLTKESPLPITGSITGSKNAKSAWEELAERLQAREKKEKDLRLARRLREEAVEREFYDEGKINSYAYDLSKLHGDAKRVEPLLEDEFLPQLVGEVHIVEPGGASTRTGLAILIKPDGTCWTALECVKGGQLEQGVGITVRFKSGESIDCRIHQLLDYHGLVVELAPVEGSSHAFKRCMLPSVPFPTIKYYTLNKSMKLDKCLIVEDNVMVPRSPEIDPGAPIFDNQGILIAIVTHPGLGKFVDDVQDSGSALQKLGTAWIRVRNRTIPELAATLHYTAAFNYTDFLREVSEHKWFMAISPISWKAPVQEWRDKHPVEGFLEKAPPTTKRRKLVRGSS